MMMQDGWNDTQDVTASIKACGDYARLQIDTLCAKDNTVTYSIAVLIEKSKLRDKTKYTADGMPPKILRQGRWIGYCCCRAADPQRSQNTSATSIGLRFKMAWCR